CSVAELIQRVQAGASGLGYQVSPTPDGFVMVAHRNAQVIAGSGTIQATQHVRLDEVTKTYSDTDEVRETGLGSFSFTRSGRGSSKSIANSSTSRVRVSKKVYGVRFGPHGQERYSFDTAAGRLLVDDVARQAGWTVAGGGSSANSGLIIGIGSGVAGLLVAGVVLALVLVLA